MSFLTLDLGDREPQRALDATQKKGIAADPNDPEPIAAYVAMRMFTVRVTGPKLIISRTR